MSAETKSCDIFTFFTNRLTRLTERLEGKGVLLSQSNRLKEFYGVSGLSSTKYVPIEEASDIVVLGYYPTQEEQGGLTPRGEAFISKTIDLYIRTQGSNAPHPKVSLKLAQPGVYKNAIRQLTSLGDSF